VERTFVLVKPDGVQRRLVGEIIRRFENKGLKLVALKAMKVTPDRAHKHYAEHAQKPFFGELVKFITSAPTVAMVWEGRDAISLSRVIIGATKPADATPGSIRGDYALFTGQNLIHGSDGKESAAKEIENFFSKDELLDYDLTIGNWIG
jgi:nucleoside-diphosphate kinase